MKGIAATLGAACLFPLLLAGTAAMAAAEAAAAQNASCAPDAGIDTEAVARQVATVLGGKKPDRSLAIPGLDVPGEQIPNAETIVATGITLHIPDKGQVIALATALQESDLRNLASGDRDSLGLFQQRPSQGWGTPAQIRDPVYAATRFYTALLQVPGWQQMTVTEAAQAVQKSGFGDAYAKWEPLARALQTAFTAALPGAAKNTTTGPAPAASAAGGCTTGKDGVGFGPIPAGTVPGGYAIPVSAPGQVRTAIRWALGQLGTPYQWGGSCTAAHGPDPMGRCDCSSLMQQAYAAAGITLPRTTYEQVKQGKPVATSALAPGDLLFTEPGPAGPGHVGMYIGSGLIINAPHTSDVVRPATLADWTPQIVAARRIVP